MCEIGGRGRVKKIFCQKDPPPAGAGFSGEQQVYSNPSLWENWGDKCTDGYCTTQSGNPFWTKWMTNSYIQENKWITACTGDYILFSQTSVTGVMQCLKSCPSNLPYQTSSKEWVATCPITIYLRYWMK